MFPPPPCFFQHLSHDSFKALEFTNLETGREKPHPCSASSHPLSADDLSQRSTSLEMALFLFRFSLKSFHNTLSCHLFLVLLFNADSHNCIYYWNFIPSGSHGLLGICSLNQHTDFKFIFCHNKCHRCANSILLSSLTGSMVHKK